MPNRLRLFDLRLSRLPGALGLCSSDIVGIRDYVNGAQERLLFAKEAGDESWNGTWAEMFFTLTRDNPYLTLPREVARLEKVTVCNRPVIVHNQFFEYLQFGNGRMPQCNLWRSATCLTQAYARNNVVTFTDLSNAPQLIAIYFSDPADVGRRVFLQGTDNNGNIIYSQDGLFEVQGVYLTLAAPFVMSAMQFNTITGIQKDITSGPIQIFQVNPTTGAQVLIHTMEAGEQVASYRRYFYDKLPFACCPDPAQTPQPVNITALAKLEPIPVVADPDYLLLTNKEAIISECMAMRYEKIDTPTAKQMSTYHHLQAIRFLNGELSHTQGLNLPDVQFKPFGSAALSRQKIGSLM